MLPVADKRNGRLAKITPRSPRAASAGWAKPWSAVPTRNGIAFVRVGFAALSLPYKGGYLCFPDQLGNQGIVSRGGGAWRAGGADCCGTTCSRGCGGGAIRSVTLTGFGASVGCGVLEKRERSGGG